LAEPPAQTVVGKASNHFTGRRIQHFNQAVFSVPGVGKLSIIANRASPEA
jgi:hypothetical protein